MNFSSLIDLFAPKPRKRAVHGRHHVIADDWPDVVYAVGDVHGCLAQLQQMHEAIAQDAANIDGSKWIVLLGDYIDRGPHSAGVIDYLLSAPPPGFTRINLVGNHELMMIDYLDRPSDAHYWLQVGAEATLQSYGIDAKNLLDRTISTAQRRQMLDAYLPIEHINFLRNLPVSCSLPGAVLVHAGMRAGVPLAEQTEDDLLWMRYADDEVGPDGVLTIHGHTPQAMPLVLPNRICVDTGAFATGVLSAVRLSSSSPPKILQVSS